MRHQEGSAGLRGLAAWIGRSSRLGLEECWTSALDIAIRSSGFVGITVGPLPRARRIATDSRYSRASAIFVKAIASPRCFANASISDRSTWKNSFAC